MRSPYLLFAAVLAAAACNHDDELTSTQRLGQDLFFDRSLSLNNNQACAVCHTGDVGWTGPDEHINAGGSVYEGSVSGRFGNRKPPASAYAPFAPLFTIDENRAVVGGNFWDGRATGWKLGQAAADQAQGPFLNPVEQALPDAATLVAKVCGSSSLGDQMRSVWGADACDNTDTAFANIARSIAAFEASSASSAFTSKYDAYLAGRTSLDATELRGLELWNGKAKCSNCHPAERDASGGSPLLTDFTYDNLGVPMNPENPFYSMDTVLLSSGPINPQGTRFVDTGVAHFLDELAASDAWRAEPFVTAPFLRLSSAELLALAAENRGKQRVPTIRNVDKRPSPGFVKAYTHNGYFKTLEALVHFYNTRDVLPRCPTLLTEAEAMAAECWPAPEVADNLNREELGNLGLTIEEEQAVVAFMRTLSDGFSP